MDAESPKGEVGKVCEAHGLRYDPGQHAGCIVCRRGQGVPKRGTWRGPPMSPAMQKAMISTLFAVVAGIAPLVDQERQRLMRPE
jgi:hypothetical protein